MVERLRASFIRLLSARPDVARETLGALCESPSERVVHRSADEIWVTKDGRALRIGEMAPEHLAHTLALICRTARENNVVWYMKGNALRCMTRDKFLRRHKEHERPQEELKFWENYT